MYNNQYGGSNSRYGFTPYANAYGKPMNSRYGNPPTKYNRNNQQIVKHSGCSAGQTKDGKPYVRGWKFDKRNGLRSFIAGPTKNTENHKNKLGTKVWQNWAVKITMPSGESFLKSCLYDTTTGKVIINELGYVMNPKGGRGGYVGSFTNK